MRLLVTPKEMREAEAAWFAETGLPPLLAMERAALAVAQAVLERRKRRVLIYCGAGNNGGDGYAAARLLHGEGVDVALRIPEGAKPTTGDAALNEGLCRRLGLPFLDAIGDFAPDAVVDALFGTGLSRAAEGGYAAAIEEINALREKGAAVIAVDIPSGIDGRDGRAAGPCVQADETVTFGWAKRGHLLQPGKARAGKLRVCSIGLSAAFAPKNAARQLDEADIKALLPPREETAYKNQFGHGLLIAGSPGMAGAAILATKAALSGGLGLCTCATDAATCLLPVQLAAPCAMAYPLPNDESAGEALLPALQGKKAAAIGPGLGQSEAALAKLKAAWASSLPLILDADALNLLAAHRATFPRRALPLLMTPHLGEAKRLLPDAPEDPCAFALALAREYGAFVLLKGSTTVIASPDGRLTLNATGTPALATGGSGDTLTGLSLAFLCQGLSPYDALCAAAFLHGRSARLLSQSTGIRAFSPLTLAENDWFKGLETH